MTFVARIPVRGIGIVAGVVPAAVATGHPHIAAALEGKTPAPREAVVRVGSGAVGDIAADVVLGDEVEDVLPRITTKLQQLPALVVDEGDVEDVVRVLLDEAPVHLNFFTDHHGRHQLLVDEQMSVDSVLEGDVRRLLERDRALLLAGLHLFDGAAVLALARVVVEVLLLLRTSDEEVYEGEQEKRKDALDRVHLCLCCEGALGKPESLVFTRGSAMRGIISPLMGCRRF